MYPITMVRANVNTYAPAPATTHTHTHTPGGLGRRPSPQPPHSRAVSAPLAATQIAGDAYCDDGAHTASHLEVVSTSNRVFARPSSPSSANPAHHMYQPSAPYQDNPRNRHFAEYLTAPRPPARTASLSSKEAALSLSPQILQSRRIRSVNPASPERDSSSRRDGGQERVRGGRGGSAQDTFHPAYGQKVVIT